MAEIDFKCPECSRSITSDDSLCGESMVCPGCNNEITIPIPGLMKGMMLGDFELMTKLGSGSMGEVWLAYQTTMDRKVAVKVLSPKYTSDARFIDRFMKEVKNSAKLSHPNIVTAFYAGMDKGHYYLAISYVDGNTVEDVQEKNGIFPEKDALKIILDIANALEYSWDKFKILHRDVKPANIMLTKSGNAMLLDLGIAKSLNEESGLTMTGTVVGTPYYISPEQAMAEEDIDFRTDIYSLGTTLYHMVTGTVPYNGTTAMAIIMKHLNEPFPPPETHNNQLSEGCCKLITKMMEKEREKRHHSWGELKSDIEKVLGGKLPEVTSSSHSASSYKPHVNQKNTSASKNSDGKMKMKLILGGVAAIFICFLIILAVVGFFIFKKKNAPPSKNRSVSALQGNITKTPKKPAAVPKLPDVRNNAASGEGGNSESAYNVKPVDVPETDERIKSPEKSDAVEDTANSAEKFDTSQTFSSTSGNVKKDESSSSSETVDSSKIVSLSNVPGLTEIKKSGDEDRIKYGMTFDEFCSHLDLTKQNSIVAKKFFYDNRGKEFCWTGKMVSMKGRPGKYQILVNNDSRINYRGYNIVIVSYTSDGSVPALKPGETFRFRGNLYNYKAKSNGLVIPYLKNAVIVKE